MPTEHSNDAWQSLITTALLGTGHGEPGLPPLDGPVAALLQRIPAESAEQRLLASAGVISLHERAGWRPAAQTRAPLPPVAEDETPACSLRAGSQLRRVLETGLDDLLTDWCRNAAAAGFRAPDELLPVLLQLLAARKHTDLEDAIAAVVGARGRWLASLNPAWAASLSPEESWETVWQTGSNDERLAALRGLRRRDPTRARELVESTWSQEEPDSRVAILQVLRSNLSSEDEALLETALADKRKPVRLAAADLLARLPASKYCQRIAEQTRRFVQFETKRGLLGRRKLTLAPSVPPEEFKLSHEGIEARASGDIGPRAMMLAQMLAATPLRVWTQAADAGPKEILAVARDSEWHNVLILGWTHAAARQGDPAWAEPLLREYLECKSEKDLERLRPHSSELMACLPPAGRETIAEQAMRQYVKARSFAPAWQILRDCGHAWSRTFSETTLDALVVRFDRSEEWQGPQTQNNAFGGPYEPWMSRESAGWLAVQLDPVTFDGTTKSWNQRIPTWRPAVQRFAEELLGLLQVRREYLKEFSS